MNGAALLPALLVLPCSSRRRPLVAARPASISRIDVRGDPQIAGGVDPQRHRRRLKETTSRCN
jgi:predicted metalloprotease